MRLSRSATLISLAVAAGLLLGPVPVVDAAPPVPARLLAVAGATTASTFGPAAPSAQQVAKKYKNCKALNKKYQHGVGKKGAKDHTSSGRPVTDFTRNNAVYTKNHHLDRDHDKIACEKH